MTTYSPVMGAGAEKRARQLITPEGLALPLSIASRGARFGALMLDLTIIFLGFVVLGLVLSFVGLSTIDLESGGTNATTEFIVIILILLVFFSRYGYFLCFELGPRGATPGKRALGIRVAARDGGRLTAEMVIARNLMRDVELFIPLFFLISGGSFGGVSGIAATIWLVIFLGFPLFNRDALRAGDVIAGTWVVDARRVKLQEAMSLAPDHSATYRFGEEELSIYGEHELQVLESVLRKDNENALAEVAQAICAKIGWDVGSGDEREFLESFYGALRKNLEGDMRFGKRKQNKFAKSASYGEQTKNYRFAEHQLSIYDAKQLKVLQDVIERANDSASLEVAETIAAKIGQEIEIGEQHAFLSAYRAALSEHIQNREPIAKVARPRKN